MLLLWKQGRVLETCGPKYFYKLFVSGWLEKSHVFTCFHNHLGLKIPGYVPEGLAYDSGAIIRVYHNQRMPALGIRETISHTHRIQAAADPMPVNVWGPFIGGMSAIPNEALAGDQEVCIVAGGSAICFLLDAMQIAVRSPKSAPLTCLFTCQDEELYDFASAATAAIYRLKAPETIIRLSINIIDQQRKELAVPDRRRLTLIQDQLRTESPCNACPFTRCGRRASQSPVRQGCRR